MEWARKGSASCFRAQEASQTGDGSDLGLQVLTGYLLAEDGDKSSCEREVAERSAVVLWLSQPTPCPMLLVSTSSISQALTIQLRESSFPRHPHETSREARGVSSVRDEANTGSFEGGEEDVGKKLCDLL